MRVLAASLLILGLSGACGCNMRKPRVDVARPVALPEKIVLDNGLQIEELALGQEGQRANKGNIVAIHYTGWLQDGTTVIDTTRNRQPLQFQLGEGTVLKGWDIGVQGMKVGGKRKLTVPPALAFGKRELGQIKPDSTLVFEVELVKVD
jgi:FKBP-type peptidyl-prolyl cis-trans isomerase FkpA